MLRLAEEPRVVGGNEIHQLLDFIRALRGAEHGAVVVIGNEPQRPQALAQPVGQHGLLVRTEPDPAVLVHQSHQRPVGLGGKRGRERRMHSGEPDPRCCRLRSS